VLERRRPGFVIRSMSFASLMGRPLAPYRGSAGSRGLLPRYKICLAVGWAVTAVQDGLARNSMVEFVKRHVFDIITIALAILGVVPLLLETRGINVPSSLVTIGRWIMVLVIVFYIYLQASQPY
jgi:hypothetical protein